MKLLFWIWCFPQQLLGFIISLFFGKRIVEIEKYKQSNIYWIKNWKRGVSLGQYVLLGDVYKSPELYNNTIKHEYGHTIQSLIFGPTYLIIIALPSITMNIISQLNKNFAKNYFKRWPENWADKLGGVKR